MTLGERLRYARKRAGLALTQVAERTAVGVSSLSDFENAKRDPSLGQLQALAQAYHRSIAFFFAEEPPPREVVLWRERPAEAAAEIEARFLRLCEQYHNLEIWCDERAATRLPQEKGAPQGFGYPQAENLAKRIRNDLQLGGCPGPALLRVLEEVCGVKVFHWPFEPTGTAASVISDTFGAAILLNAADVRWRRHFDLAHEIFHLVTWNVFRTATDPSSAVPAEREEKLATCFARNLLMPAEAVREAVNLRLKDGKLAFGSLFDIAREFDVSVEALLWQMHMLFGWREEETRRKIEKATPNTALFEEREEERKREKDAPPQWPARYHALAVKALHRGEISIGRFAEYLGISRQEATKYIEQEIADDEEVQITPA